MTTAGTPTTASPPGLARTGGSLWWALGPAVALVLASLCLRGPFSAVGPVLGELGDEFSLSTGALAVVTALPLVCFGLVSPFAPGLAARFGVHRAVVVGMAVIAAGILLRLGGAPGLFAGTVLLTGGIAIVNVLAPAAARAEYGAKRAAAVVGLVTAAMATSASAGAGLAQPLTSLAGSARVGLALWLAPVTVALLAVAVLARRRRTAPKPESTAPGSRTAILRDRVALAVTLYFGIQSLSFYAMLTWLPGILQAEAGVSRVGAGALVALAALLGVPASLVVPTLATRRPSQVGWVVAVSVPTVVGIAGLLVAPAAAPLLWAVLYGLGTGAAFPLAMTLVLRRTRDVAQTGRLSASAQSIGYLIAASGPLAVGLLHDATDSWTPALVLLLVAVLAQIAIGIPAGRAHLVRADA
ncbi:MFS transporter [Blastococcus sp. PRF04-17]|uniref:MFS transporter n=1 Tax=Blastococcus sp. PRF04-17 TaxID=2933797 RepID=UPI001FF30C24|nr:MFS transporter [Blastococcus sp. PRF04-17]UOY00296.1 MFS transporter [Blastococcus sp. PRF04-17]